MELFECRNCFHIGTLTVRGGCEACGSCSVISQELLSVQPYCMSLHSDRPPIRSTDIWSPMGLA